MSDPYRAGVCGECGKPHDPPAICRRCKNPAGRPLFGRPACTLCALRAAPEFATRAVRAATVFVFRCVVFLVTLYAGLALGAVGIAGLGGFFRHERARDFSPYLILEAETSIDELEESRPAHKPIEPSPPPPPAVASACPRDLLDITVPRLLAGLGPETRDPRALLARASRLAAAGFDVVVTRAVLPVGLAASAEPPTITPVRLNGGVAGVCLEGTGILTAEAGLLRGDVITSINGVPIVRPDLALEAYASARLEGMAVIELLRDERRVIVGVLFPEVTRGARARAASRP